MTIVTTGGADLSAQAHRNQTSLLLLPGLTPLAAVDGVHTGLNISKTSGMGFSISVGRAAVNGVVPEEGAFAVTVTAPEVSAFEPGDATRNRIDLVVLQTFPENPYDSAAQIVVVKGAYPASGLPVVPATPAGSMPMYRVPINAGVSAGNGGWDATKAVDVRPSIGITRWNNFTPTWINATLGSGFKSTGRWRRDGDSVHVQARLIFGTNPSWGTGKTMHMLLPVSRESDAFRQFGRAIHIATHMGSLYYDVVAVGSGIDALAFFSTSAANALKWMKDSGYPISSGNVFEVEFTYSINPADLG